MQLFFYFILYLAQKTRLHELNTTWILLSSCVHESDKQLWGVDFEEGYFLGCHATQENNRQNSPCCSLPAGYLEAVLSSEISANFYRTK
jgi:hypothetical protein